MKTYIEYCKEHAINELENLKDWGKMIYGCDLGYELTDEINANGSATFSTVAAREYGGTKLQRFITTKRKAMATFCTTLLKTPKHSTFA